MRRFGSWLLTGFVLFAAKPATAESLPQSDWAHPVVSMTLLEGFRAPSPQHGSMMLGSGAPQAARGGEEPGEVLSAAVEKMWSQVRAYRRPGGAELIVRGRF